MKISERPACPHFYWYSFTAFSVMQSYQVCAGGNKQKALRSC